MKVLLALIALLTLSGFVLFNQEQSLSLQSSGDIEIMKKFIEFKSQFGLNYNGSEEEYRFAQFKANYLFIEQHNKKGESLQLKLTQFAALSNQEYRETTLLQSKPQRNVEGNYYPATGANLPDTINWVEKGAVYATQNQGSCGSCWAFATIGGLQGLRYIVTGDLELLSAQQITSCTPKEFLDDKTQGCNGGEAQYAYQYTADNGIETWADYPYTDGNSRVASECLYNKEKVVFYNEGVGFVPHNDVQAMKENLNNQPLSIAVDAGSIYFQLYSTGIIKSENCGIELNHAILLVGYNLEGPEPYWTVQNSWGTGWGNGGFGNILISEGNGICGINMQVDFPTSIDQ